MVRLNTEFLVPEELRDNAKEIIEKASPKRHLAEEIIEEILSRLPVKYLLRFGCVSKSWFSLIGSERFIKTHLQISRESGGRMVIFNYLEDNDGSTLTRKIKQCSLHSLMSEKITNLSTFDQSMDDVSILGCCNGLVCTLSGISGSLHLCNPSSRISIELPKLNCRSSVSHYGFGWDESSDAYKVFAFLYDRPVYKVYSSKTNEWKTVGQTALFNYYYSSNEEKGAFVSGKLHWQRENGAFVEIVSLDLKSEVIEIMDHPCRQNHSRASLRVFEGLLSVLQIHEKEVDVWVMKEYGVKDSWSKIRSLPLKKFSWVSHLSVAPLGVGPNGEILVSFGPIFSAYNPEDSIFFYHPQSEVLLQLKKIKHQGLLSMIKIFRRLGDGGVHIYSESLVSPKRIIEC